MFRGSSSHFRFDHFYIVDFHSALTTQVSVQKSEGWVKIYNVKMVKTEMARGPPKLCRNQKSFWIYALRQLLSLFVVKFQKVFHLVWRSFEMFWGLWFRFWCWLLSWGSRYVIFWEMLSAGSFKCLIVSYFAWSSVQQNYSGCLTGGAFL